MLLDLLTRVLYVLHAIAQLTFNAETFLLSHLIKPSYDSLYLAQHGSSHGAIRRQRRRIEGAWDAHDRIQIRFSSQPELRRCGSESLDVSTHDLPIQRQTLAATSLKIEGKLPKPPRHLPLQQPADSHFRHPAIPTSADRTGKD